jgi:hypothetical protein
MVVKEKRRGPARRAFPNWVGAKPRRSNRTTEIIYKFRDIYKTIYLH